MDQLSVRAIAQQCVDFHISVAISSKIQHTKNTTNCSAKSAMQWKATYYNTTCKTYFLKEQVVIADSLSLALAQSMDIL